MTTKDLTLLILGALVGAVVSAWYGASLEKLRIGTQMRRVRHRQNLARSGVLATRALRYYQRRGLAQSLFMPNTMPVTHRIPLLFNEELRFSGIVRTDGEEVLRYDGSEKASFAVSRMGIRYLQRRGIRLFDGEILYVKSVAVSAEGLACFTVARCNYYAYATLSLQLQREIRPLIGRPVLHDRYLKKFELDGLPGLQPQAVGCNCVTVFHDASGATFVAIANRSSEVLNANDVRSVVPNFGMESNVLGTSRSRYGLFFYNFLREFAEEFFDLEVLVQAMASRRSDPDWIFGLPQLKPVEAEIASGRFRLHCTGIGVNPFDGALNCAIVAEFQSVDFFEWLRREVRANWESTNEEADTPPIDFLRINDDRINGWAVAGQLDQSSIFALDLARRFLGTDSAANAGPSGSDSRRQA